MSALDLALTGARPPPTELFVQGGGGYLSSMMRPSNTRGQGADAPPRVDAVRAVLAQAEARLAECPTEPVHVKDLHETSMRLQQELLDRDAMVLNFRAFSLEAVPNSPMERARARIMEFFFHVVDGTLRVYEPPQDNSGLYQGKFTARHVPFRPDGSGASYAPTDFTIGARIVVSGREFTVVDASAETRALMRSRYGIELGAPLAVPATYLGGRPDLSQRLHANKVVCDVGDMEDPEAGFYRKMPDTKGKFMEHGSAMLRFEGEWRETGEHFGDRRRFALQYYLADDTLEILDKTSPHAQGGQFSKFVARQRLPRLALEAGTEAVVSISGMSPAGGATRDIAAAAGVLLPDAQEVIAASQTARGLYKYTDGPTVWGRFLSPITGKPSFVPSTTSVGGVSTCGGLPVLTALASSPNFVTAADLICGGVISIFGRPLILKSCDPFTVAFGLHRLGIDQRRFFIVDPATVASERAAAMPQNVPRGPIALPPHTGALAIGSEEETRVNATRITPTFRAERNFDRFYQLAGKALRFEAALDAGLADPDDAPREFVVSFYLEDDTLAIVEVHRDRNGARATRFLNRGRHRNALTLPEPRVQAAVQGARGDMVLSQPTQAAYDRVYGASGDKFGYSDSFGGQGYSGGIFGKAERTGPGGTGVASAADMGIRDGLTHSFLAPPRHFVTDDFHEGASIHLHHMPGVVFVLGRADGFTSQWLAARDAQGGRTSDARDVYVPESKAPVPTLPLEGVSGSDAAPLACGEEPSADAQFTDDCLMLAKVLAGVMASAQEVMRQADKGKREYAPRAFVASALARYGVAPPAVPQDVIERMLDAHTVGSGGELVAAEQAKENARSTRHALHRSAPAASVPGGSPLSSLGRSLPRTPAGEAEALMRATGNTVGGFSDPLVGPRLTDFGARAFSGDPMVAYPKLFQSIKDAAGKQQSLQPRLEKLVPQLRAALLSSRAHVRRVFRDLDTASTGVISFKEFRHLLLRHQLDVGLSDGQVRAIMRRFPPAEVGANDPATGEPQISFRGFVESLLDAATLAPGEVESFMDFVRGIHNSAPEGVGGTYTTPQLYPHVNKVSSWAADTMDLTRFGITERATATGGAGAAAAARGGASASRPATAPAAPPRVPDASVGARSSVTWAGGEGTRAAQPPPAPPGGGAAATAVFRSSSGSAPLKATLGGSMDVSQPGARPRTAPVGCLDPRPALANPVVDVVDALRATERGCALLERVRHTFGTRRLDLYRALMLYDTRRTGTLAVRAFLDALVSAGLKLTMGAVAELTRTLTEAAAAPGARAAPNAADVSVDFNAFLETAF